jgi:hypothetical protein
MQDKIIIKNINTENVVQFKYLEITLRNKHFIQGVIKRRLKSDNAGYHSIQNLLASHLMSTDITINVNSVALSPQANYTD